MHLQSRSLLFGILVVVSLLMPRVTRADGGPPPPDAAFHLADRPDNAVASDPVTVAVEAAKRVEAIQAAERAGDATALRLAIAGLLALVLRFVVQGIKRLSNLSDEAKRVIPWVVLVLGVVIGVVDHLAIGDAWVHAIIIGAAAPGSVLVHELLSNLTPTKADTVAKIAGLLVLVGVLGGCDLRPEWIGASAIALGIGIVVLVVVLSGRPKNLPPLVVLILATASTAFADVVRCPGAPMPSVWGMLVVPAILVGIVVLGAGVVKFLLWSAERRHRAAYGPLVLVLLAGVAHADPPAAESSMASMAPPSQNAAPAPAAAPAPVEGPVVAAPAPAPRAETPPPAALDPRKAIAAGASSPDAATCARCATAIVSLWKQPSGKLAIAGIVLGTALQLGLQIGLPVALHDSSATPSLGLENAR